MDITTRLAGAETIIIDGAMGTELQRRGVPLNFEIWSAAALLSHPHLVREIHVDYLRAGAEIQIAATYNTAPHVINPSSFDTTSQELTATALRLVREGIDVAKPAHPVWIAGSISTTVESRRKEMLDIPMLRDSYTEHAETLAEQGCDLLMLEMMLTHDFAMDLEFQCEIAAIAKRTGLPVWAGIAVKMAESGTLHLRTVRKSPARPSGQASKRSWPKASTWPGSCIAKSTPLCRRSIFSSATGQGRSPSIQTAVATSVPTGISTL